MKSYLSSAASLFIFVTAGSWAARNFGLYNAYWYTDVILHLVSGIALGLTWLGLNRGVEKRRHMLILEAASFAVLGSVAWELWEFAGWRITTSGMRYYVPELADTLSDLCYGALGGALAVMGKGRA